MISEIKITNSSECAQIDIEGIIGIPESAQFEQPDLRVATYERFMHALSEIKEIKAERVVINIRSTGGNVNDALLIYDAVMELGIEVVTRCYGYVASAATIIAQCASAGNREISANALYLIHCCESSCEGNSQSLQITKELLDKSDERIAAIYADRSGGSMDNFITLMKENGGKGRWLTPDETVAYALTDRIIASSPIENSMQEEMELMGLPPLPKASGHEAISARLTELWHRILALIGLGQKNPDMEVSDSTSHSVIESLTDRIEQLEHSCTSHLATPTITKQTEDPGIGEPQRTENQAAYEADLSSFKTV